MKIVNVVGARPNFMKMAPLVRALGQRGLQQRLLHTGQHYDKNMSKVFFEDLEMPAPDIYLGIGSGSHAEQTARVMVEFEKVCMEDRPDLIVVVGDVNSTLACSVVGAKLWIPVAHVEAGLRSFDMQMPEEVNRLVTDRLSSLLLTHSPEADDHLRNEGVPAEKIHRVGNIMIDSLVRFLEKSRESKILSRVGLEPQGYAVVTLHRPSNVDEPGTLLPILGALHEIAEEIPVIFSCHPRTAAKLEQLEGYRAIADRGDLRILPPQGYLDFLRLMAESRLVLTDSGGLQEETTYLGIPCVTIRENTERPITVSQGTNVLVGTDPDRIREAARPALDGRAASGSVPEFWDGKTAGRIVDVFEDWWRAR